MFLISTAFTPVLRREVCRLACVVSGAILSLMCRCRALGHCGPCAFRTQTCQTLICGVPLLGDSSQGQWLEASWCLLFFFHLCLFVCISFTYQECFNSAYCTISEIKKIVWVNVYNSGVEGRILSKSTVISIPGCSLLPGKI